MPQSKGSKKCLATEVYNEKSNRCVDRNGPTGRKILGLSPKRVSRKSRVIRKSKSPKVSRRSKSPKVSRRSKSPKVSRRSKLSPGRKSSRKSLRRSSKVCESGKIINPETGYCVKIDSVIGKRIRGLTSSKSRVSRRSSPKVYRRSSYRICEEGKIINPKTGYCVKENSAIGRKIRGLTLRDSDDYVINPITYKPVKKSTSLGQRILKGELKKIEKSVIERISTPKLRFTPNKEINCIKRSKLELKPYQVKAVEYMQKNDAIFILFGTGCGKTLTSITISQCFLDANPKSKVVLIAPTSLLENFKKEMTKYGVKNKNSYELYSFDKFYRLAKDPETAQLVDLSGKMLIIDEIHNLRNTVSKKSAIITYESSRASKRVLLSATPFVNDISDFIPIINILYGEHVIDSYKISLETIQKHLANRIIVEDCYDPIYFPERVDKIVNINMTDEYYDKYVKVIEDSEDRNTTVFSNPAPFYNGHRRAVNSLGGDYFSNKIQKIVNIIKNGRTIIYSNWLDFGLIPIAKALKKNKISFTVFSSETPKKDRQDMVNAFNNGEFQALIISKVGGEGLDTKEVNSVIVMDPPWNDSGLQQIIGRAIRFNSHAGLSPSKRVVHVYFMKLIRPKNMKSIIFSTGDEILYEIIEEKNKRSKEIMDALKRISI
jgi:superfamily II DNA or RNA helicase